MTKPEINESAVPQVNRPGEPYRPLYFYQSMLTTAEQIAWLQGLKDRHIALLPYDVRDLLLMLLRKIEQLEKERGIPL